jgi:starch synthase
MASGLPVITTTNTGGRDIITDGIDGFIVPIRDVSAIKERLVYLYENPDKRMEMGLAARKKAELYSWDRYYQEIAKVLDAVYMKDKKPSI